jgi:microcystin-dependent protein
MACSNCYNGCTDIVSDQCVKYTGIDVPVLGIKKGDSLSYVEQALIEFLTSTLNGTGIKIDIPATTIICNLVQQYLPTCGDLTAVDLFNALIQASCDLQAQINITNGRIDNIESPYLPGCFTTITESSSTHEVVQAIITKVCGVESDLSALSIDVSTNYVKLADLCELVTACVNQNNPVDSGKYYTKMVPFTAVEYYGSLQYFDSTGAGIGNWEKIYLCNGDNGTPDKRGRVPVGSTAMPGTIPMDSAVAPGGSGGFNPTYNLYTKAGSNTVTLSKEQIPTHSHPGSSAATTISPSSHTHSIPTGDSYTGNPYSSSRVGQGQDNNARADRTTGAVTLTASTNLTIAEDGGGLPHANNQPAIACYYIMYIP